MQQRPELSCLLGHSPGAARTLKRRKDNPPRAVILKSKCEPCTCAVVFLSATSSFSPRSSDARACPRRALAAPDTELPCQPSSQKKSPHRNHVRHSSKTINNKEFFFSFLITSSSSSSRHCPGPFPGQPVSPLHFDLQLSNYHCMSLQPEGSSTPG